MNRKFRLLAGLGIAMLLSIAMVYTALANSSVQRPVVRVGELGTARRLADAQSKTVELVAVAQGPITGQLGRHITFFAVDAKGNHRVRVSYDGSVPDAFRVGRSIVVSGRLHGSAAHGTFRALRDSLVTKCPSKFQGSSGSAKRAAA